MKSISKSELASAMSISQSTLRYYLNVLWYSDLKNEGYYKSQKILSPKLMAVIKFYWDCANDSK